MVNRVKLIRLTHIRKIENVNSSVENTFSSKGSLEEYIFKTIDYKVFSWYSIKKAV